MPGNKTTRRYIVALLCLVLSACGKGQGSQVDDTKAKITPQQIEDRQTDDLNDEAFPIHKNPRRQQS